MLLDQLLSIIIDNAEPYAVGIMNSKPRVILSVDDGEVLKQSPLNWLLGNGFVEIAEIEKHDRSADEPRDKFDIKGESNEARGSEETQSDEPKEKLDEPAYNARFMYAVRVASLANTAHWHSLNLVVKCQLRYQLNVMFELCGKSFEEMMKDDNLTVLSNTFGLWRGQCYDVLKWLDTVVNLRYLLNIYLYHVHTTKVKVQFYNHRCDYVEIYRHSVNPVIYLPYYKDTTVLPRSNEKSVVMEIKDYCKVCYSLSNIIFSVVNGSNEVKYLLC